MKKPTAFIVPGRLAIGGVVLLPEEERRHARARRLRAGSPVRLVDGSGGMANGKIERLSRAGIEVRVEELLRPGDATPRITLLAPVLRSSRLSWLVEKATELGASKIILVATSRAQGDRVALASKDRDRLARIVREASKQCGRLFFPPIEGPAGFIEALGSSAECRLILDPSGGAFPVSLRGASLALWAGPEGGFTEEELRAAESAGWAKVRLAGSTLRAETAVLAGLALAARAIDSAGNRADNGSTR